MAEWISKSGRGTNWREYHEFSYVDDPRAGFAILLASSLPGEPEPQTPEQQARYEQLKAGYVDTPHGPQAVIDNGIRRNEWTYRIDGVIQCERCSQPVELSSSFSNSCTCGAEYNLFGQRLAPRSQWGEETRESIADMQSTYDPESIYQEGYYLDRW